MPDAGKLFLLRDRDALVVTRRSGLPLRSECAHIAAGSRAGAGYVNAGAMGRPANDGRTCVWYATLSTDADRLEVEHVPVRYDHEALAREMAREGI